MKITRRQLRRIIRDRSNQPVDPRKMRAMGYSDAIAGKYMDPRYENQIDYKMGFNDGLDDIDDESSATGSMYEGNKITRKQLRRLIREELNLVEADSNGDGSLSPDELRDLADDLEGETMSQAGEAFPDLSHPLISPYADKMGYSGTGREGGWFKSYQSYRYNAGGPSEQGINVYLLPDGQYMARIVGSFNNTLSNDRRAGRHPDAASAIEAALDSSPSASGPAARELLKRVGEKVDTRGYFGQD